MGVFAGHSILSPLLVSALTALAITVRRLRAIVRQQSGERARFNASSQFGFQTHEWLAARDSVASGCQIAANSVPPFPVQSLPVIDQGLCLITENDRARRTKVC